MSISLDKVREAAPVDFVKRVERAQFSVSRVGLDGHQARVGLVIDRSGSCQRYFRDGTIQEAAERMVALATQLDDDGEIDVFGFHSGFWHAGTLNLGNYAGGIDRLFTNEWGGTEYAPAIRGVTQHYFGGRKRLFRHVEADRSVPAFVQFITDGECTDRAETKRALTEVSSEPVFFNFVGIGSERFATLRALDDMDGRTLDNADFFQASDLRGVSDMDAFGKMLVEYPDWVRAASAAGVLT